MTPRLERQIQVMDDLLRAHPPNVPVHHPLPGASMGNHLAMYPSAPGGSVGANFPPGFVPNPAQYDPFTVRPRTSNTFHPVPYPHMPRASMNEEQLRFMMVGGSPRNHSAYVARPLAQHPQLPPQSHHMVFPSGHPAGPPPQAFQHQPPPQLSQQQQPLRVIPPQYLPHSPSEPGPLTAPPISPSYNLPLRPNPANNAHLLSILNTPGIPRAVTTLPSATMGSHV